LTEAQITALFDPPTDQRELIQTEPRDRLRRFRYLRSQAVTVVAHLKSCSKFDDGVELWDCRITKPTQIGVLSKDAPEPAEPAPPFTGA
jgi:hypothetical protein